MNSAELEQLIDVHGLEDVLRVVADVCYDKAAGENPRLVRSWQAAGVLVAMCATTANMLGLSEIPDSPGTKSP